MHVNNVIGFGICDGSVVCHFFLFFDKQKWQKAEKLFSDTLVQNYKHTTVF